MTRRRELRKPLPSLLTCMRDETGLDDLCCNRQATVVVECADEKTFAVCRLCARELANQGFKRLYSI
jgi:hypothetical protein